MNETKTLLTRFQMKTLNAEQQLDFNNRKVVPLLGEIIVYQNENNTKIKIGDGITEAESLPFIDSATLSGFTQEDFILKQEMEQVVKKTFAITLYKDYWGKDSDSLYKQSVDISNITEKDEPIIELDLRNVNPINAESVKNSWGKIDYADTTNGSIIFVCLNEKPTEDLALIGYYYTGIKLEEVNG